MKNNEQEHDTIFVRFYARTSVQKSVDEYYTASRNGNNAAWMCVCGYRLPLIWTARPNAKKYTICPECKRHYGAVVRNNKPAEIFEDKV